MELLHELETEYARLEELISAINRTNNSTLVEGKATLSDLLARRDCLKGKLNILRGFLDSASALTRRHSISEIKVKSTVNVRELQKQVDGLSKDLRELEEKERQWEEAIRENEQLRALLDLTARHRSFVLEDVRVTARFTSNWESKLTLSKGSSAGIEAGDCVITETGVLVGIVAETGINWSTVSTVINTDTQMGGIVMRTYSAGVLEGDFALMNQGKLKLNYLPEEAQLVSGDEVLTSGRGEVFPSGLEVGRVEGVFTDPSGQTRYAVVAPSVALDSLIEVFVIKDFEIVE